MKDPFRFSIIVKATAFIFLFSFFCLSHAFSSAASKSSTQQNEADMVRKQLGYLPTNYLGVSGWKSNREEPVAIKTYPLNGGAKRRQNKAGVEGQAVNSPFPTLYWLTCPEISKAVANLERRGFLQIFEQNLQENPELSQRLCRCHEEYAQQRWETLTEEDRLLLSTETPSLIRMRNMMKHSGISGTNFTMFDDSEQDDARNMPSIKCLHAHYAHYRSTMGSLSSSLNPVGEMIHFTLEQEFPDLEL